MSLQGLPDFQHFTQTDSLSFYAPYEGRGDISLLPDRLDIAQKPSGAPDFRLALIRGENPFLPPQPYGLIDFKVAPHYAIAQGLTFVRQRNAQATLAPVSFSGGYLRLIWPEQIEQIERSARLEMSAPQVLVWNGLGSARSVRRISADATGLLKKTLKEGSLLLLQAQAEMKVQGISPRVPAQIQFDPVALLMAITEHLGQVVVAKAALVQLLKEDFLALPVRLIGDAETLDFKLLAETFADWIEVRFSRSVPAPEPNEPEYIELSAIEDMAAGDYTWDLSTPLLCSRSIMLTLDPLQSSRKLVIEEGLEAVFHEITVPALLTGETTIEVQANLPEDLFGVLDLGVEIVAPPNLPYRSQAIAKSISLLAPIDRTSVRLRFAPKEDIFYQVATYMIVQTKGGVARLESEPWAHKGDRISLVPNQFPVQFVPIAASRALLKLASIQGVCCWQQANEDVLTDGTTRTASSAAEEQSFELTAASPSITLSLPQRVASSTIEPVIKLKAHDISSDKGDRTLKLGPYSADRLRLGRHSFLEYGPHKVEIDCVFPDDATHAIRFFAIDLLAESDVETAETLTTLSFSRDRPKREWAWFSESPFLSGYRYRIHTSAGKPRATWSVPQSAFIPLVITVPSAPEIEP